MNWQEIDEATLIGCDETTFRKLLVDFLKAGSASSRGEWAEAYHGPSEFGLDIVFCRSDGFGHLRYYGIQAKSKNITLKNSRYTQDIKILLGQVVMAYNRKIPVPGGEAELYGFYILSSRIINLEACTALDNARRNMPNLYYYDSRNMMQIFTTNAQQMGLI